MEMYKEAVRKNLQVQTKKGVLNVIQLCTLSVNELDELAVCLEENASKSTKKSFLTTKSAEDTTAKLAFDVVYDILMTKKAEAEVAQKAKDVKENKQKILQIIAKKKDESLEGKSVEELEVLLAAL